jgi:hypothetical protein
MAENKKSFSLYTDLIKLVNGSNIHDLEIEPMTDEEAGQLFRWILEYVNDLHPSVPKNIKFAVVQVKKQLDDDLERWKEICRKNKENISNYWKSKANENKRANTSEYECIPNDTKNTDKDKDKDKDILKENNTTINSSVKEKPTTSRFYPPTLDEVKAYCDERRNLVDPEKLFDFYSAKGWMVGKNKMKDWKAAIRTWEKEAGFKPEAEPRRLNETEEEYKQRLNGGFREL